MRTVKKRMNRARAGAFGLAIALLIPACQEAAELSADHVFLNGGIYTVDSQRSWAEAVAVTGSEITYVGGNAGARDQVQPDERSDPLSGSRTTRDLCDRPRFG